MHWLNKGDDVHGDHDVHDGHDDHGGGGHDGGRGDGHYEYFHPRLIAEENANKKKCWNLGEIWIQYNFWELTAPKMSTRLQINTEKPSLHVTRKYAAI